MNRNIETGDVIQIGRSAKVYLAIEAGYNEEGDWGAGCSYNFADLIPIADRYTDGVVTARAAKRIYTSVNGANYPVTDLKEITLVGKAKLKPIVAAEITSIMQV